MRFLSISGTHGPRLSGVVAMLTVAGLAVGMLAVPSAVADEKSPRSCAVQGHLTEGDTNNLVTVIHGNTEIDTFTHPIYFDGAFSPVGIAQERDVTDLTTFVSQVSATIVYAGRVRCDNGDVSRFGVLEIKFLATASFDTNSFVGTFRIIGSAGGLAGTSGHGTVSGVPGVPGGNGPFVGTLHLGGDA